MQFGQPRQFFAPCSQEMNLYLAPIDCTGSASDEPGFLAARHQGDDTVRLCLQSFGDLADGCPLSPRKTLRMKHQLVLQNGDAFPACGVFTEPQEASQARSEI
ncbi:hypothetical protein RCH10_005461 [Variovorax sp. GrIS 2.14]